MFGKKKKTMIDKIEKMMISSKTYSNEHVFSIHLDRAFSEIAKDGLKPILQDFILAVNERFCSGCYWLVSAYDFGNFYNCNTVDELYAIEKYIEENNTSVLRVYVDYFHILILLDKMKDDVFSMLYNIRLLDGENLHLDVFHAFFLAFSADDIENILATQRNIDVNEFVHVFYNQKMILDVRYFDSMGAKIHEITISCTPERRNEAKDCLIEVFNAHGIQLEFDL